MRIFFQCQNAYLGRETRASSVRDWAHSIWGTQWLWPVAYWWPPGDSSSSSSLRPCPSSIGWWATVVAGMEKYFSKSETKSGELFGDDWHVSEIEIQLSLWSFLSFHFKDNRANSLFKKSPSFYQKASEAKHPLFGRFVAPANPFLSLLWSHFYWRTVNHFPILNAVLTTSWRSLRDV